MYIIVILVFDLNFNLRNKISNGINKVQLNLLKTC